MDIGSSLGSLNVQASAQQTREDRMIHGMNSQASGSGSDDAKIAKGSKEFEAVLVGSWLQQAEQSFATVPGADDDADAGRDQMMSLGVQSLSTSIAATGGIGIGKMIAKAMHANVEKEKSQAASTGKPGA